MGVTRFYKVYFTIGDVGTLQLRSDLRVTESAELDANALKAFKDRLKKVVPGGTLSDDATTFTTTEPLPLPATKTPYYAISLKPLFMKKANRDLLSMLTSVNEGLIQLFPITKHVSPTAVKVVARNIQVNPSGEGMVGLPDELERKLKTYGGTTRRRGRSRSRKHRRRVY
jgi:hypothetical protein